jgi:hypothetical protein
VFTPAETGAAYRYFRLDLGAPATLAEVELLGHH